MSEDPIFQAGLKIAKKINYRHGTSYFWATLLFPPQIRDAVHILYAFFRIPDEIVDSANASSTVIISNKLQEWFKKWQLAYDTHQSDEPVLYASSSIFHRYQIPFQYSVSFFQAMEQDLSQPRYQTYEDLEKYMYGSAAVVGLMLSHVIGFSDPSALVYATKLGYAMQLTNFLRDIDEDYVQRGRIYFPQAELTQFGLSDRDIELRHFSNQFKQFVQFQIARAGTLYQEAEPGIEMLAPQGRRAVRVASRLYAKILQKIEHQDCNIFQGRARTKISEKVVIMLTTLK